MKRKPQENLYLGAKAFHATATEERTPSWNQKIAEKDSGVKKGDRRKKTRNNGAQKSNAEFREKKRKASR